MSFPTPEPGLVINYRYLWEYEARKGELDGYKNRPCAIILNVQTTEQNEVIVLPITHTQPVQKEEGIEIPVSARRVIGLDSERAWIILTETNRFKWPGPDLVPISGKTINKYEFGLTPPDFFEIVRRHFLYLLENGKVNNITRTE